MIPCYVFAAWERRVVEARRRELVARLAKGS